MTLRVGNDTCRPLRQLSLAGADDEALRLHGELLPSSTAAPCYTRYCTAAYNAHCWQRIQVGVCGMKV